MSAAILPQNPHIFLTDGGLETTLIFDEGIDLPHFAAFPLVREADGVARLEAYYERYIAIAEQAGTGFILESPTWRASPDWADRIGYSKAELAQINADAICFLHKFRARYETSSLPILVSGCVGPRGDGYVPNAITSPQVAETYHNEQIKEFARAGANFITAMTINNTPEAIGVARASMRNDLPCVISFTVETDGRLPTGQSLENAIREVDSETSGGPAYYMINCAHPSHFSSAFDEGAAWTARIGGLRSNASCLSHAELDAADELDRGDPDQLAASHVDLRLKFPSIRVFGGCCGTDHQHVSAICDAVTSPYLFSENRSHPRMKRESYV